MSTIPVRIIEIGPMSEEEKNLKITIDMLRELRQRGNQYSVGKTVAALRAASRVQNIDEQVKVVCLRELRRQALIKEIVDFDWMDT